MINRLSSLKESAPISNSHIALEIQQESSANNLQSDLVFKNLNEIKSRLSKIENYTKNIEDLHKQLLIEVDSDKATIISKKIDIGVKQLNGDADFIRITIKSLTVENDQLEGRLTSTDMKIRKTQQAKLTKKFMSLMKQFQDVQLKYQRKLKEQLERQYRIVKPDATREELDRLTNLETSGGQNTLMTQQFFTLAARANAQQQLEQMKERREDILAIQRNIEVKYSFVNFSFLFIGIETNVSRYGIDCRTTGRND